MAIANRCIRKLFHRILEKVSNSRKMSSLVHSELAYIDVESNSPFNLFSQWLDESIQFGKFKTVFFNLATADCNGSVTNRTVVLRKLNNDGFTFTTNKNSKKVQQIIENPKVSACYFWAYAKDKKHINRQIRVEGIAEKLPNEVCQDLYDLEPLFAKIRSHICQQGEKVEWNELKQKHDALLQEIEADDKTLEMPDYQVAYKILPNKFDFYYAWNNAIADRIVFVKEADNGWTYHRIAA